RVIPGIGHVLVAAAVFQTGLHAVEFRRGRGHVGVGTTRSTVGLSGRATEVLGVGGNVAETADAGRLGIVSPAARGATPIGGRQRRVGHIDRWRLRPRRGCLSTEVAGRARLALLPQQRTVVARRWWRWRRRRARADRRARSTGRSCLTRPIAAERIAGTRT